MGGDSLLARSWWRRTLLNLPDDGVVDSEDLLGTWKFLEAGHRLKPSPAAGVMPRSRPVAELYTPRGVQW